MKIHIILLNSACNVAIRNFIIYIIENRVMVVKTKNFKTRLVDFNPQGTIFFPILAEMKFGVY